MSIGISAEHVELGDSLGKWAASLAGPEVARAEESDADATFEKVRAALAEAGVATIGVPESVGGGGGTAVEQSIALEACARQLVPGPLLGQVVVGTLLSIAGEAETLASLVSGEVIAFAPRAGGPVWDAPGAGRVLRRTRSGGWELATVRSSAGSPGPDLSRRFGVVEADRGVPLASVDDDLVRRVVLTFAAAEAAGVARWALETAVDYAKVREQFGRQIGSFQAVKHLCAEMLETAEAVTAAAWDAAASISGDSQQWRFAADVAGVTCFDGAVEVAQSCIQVLGGIGFTFEHDAHLYLRRALGLRAIAGDVGETATRLAERAVDGTRRRMSVDLEGRDEALRPDVAGIADDIAAAEDQRVALVDSGYLMPHWPAPHGLGADAVTQIVIDQELSRAAVVRPDVVIAGWALPTIIEHGTEEQRERFVRPSLLGELVWCQLFSEPGSGSDLASLRTRAVRVEGGWQLSGQKVWTSVAERAHWGICLARTDADVPQHKGITYFLVDMSSPGIEIRPLREITGEALFNEVFLDEVFVPDSCVVAGEGDGWRLARTTLANERVAMAASRLDRSVERAIDLAASDAVGLSAAQRAEVGRAVALATVCSLLALRTTLRSLGGHGPGAESSVAKLLGVRNRQDSSELVVSLYGDRVLAPDAEVQAAIWESLNTRCLSIAGGTTQILRNVAGERILGLPR